MTDLIGQPIRRSEDERLLRGRGHFTADHDRPGQAYLVVLRSPHAHARIVSIDAAAARAAPRVLLAYAGQDYEAAGLGIAPAGKPPLGPVSRFVGELVSPPNKLLPTDRVRFVGEPVAIVVAETAAAARDAAERIEIAYEPLPSVIDIDAAVLPGAPQLWAEAPGNLCCEIEIGDPAACAAAFSCAAHVLSIDLVNSRITGAPMEPRAALGEFDSATGTFTLTAGTQLPNNNRDTLAEHIFRVPRDKVRVISPDMGGGFGTRSQCFPELVFVLWCARVLGRPIKWQSDRSECFLTDTHGRDSVWRASLALDGEGRIAGLRVRTLSNLGAYPGHAGPLVPISAGPRVQTGVYRVPALDARIGVVFTNTGTVSPYRGAGQPEAVYLLERLLDLAAAKTGIDRVALRRRNILAPGDFPYVNMAGAKYDSGDYDAGMTLALEKADWAGFAQRRAAARQRGMMRGIGFANYVQVSGGAPAEWGKVIARSDGVVEFRVGTHSHGQGHETSFAQIIASRLEIPLERISIVEGDTDRVPTGFGTHGSRSLFKGGQIMVESCAGVIDRARRVVAYRYAVDPADVTYAGGNLQVARTNIVLALAEVASYAEMAVDLPEALRGPLGCEVTFTTYDCNFPSGTHICEVEVDPETGDTRIDRFVAVDDAGRLINPMIAEGQMHGGIVQGIGQALSERIVYDPASGQLVTGSYQDYCVPRADDLPPIEVTFQEVASPTNALGVKGIGESGPTGSTPAVISAIVDALRDYGIEHIEMPAHPERVWRAIRDSRRTPP
ncbi:MAG TPA: xanthine dehydrogenase family protein molybdopterin-binding subunit [Stellaceae bacterium]|nr:xanthine dehydrogenase family protein molybdopterin-binding subunit [Stellaceae bacterium]